MKKIPELFAMLKSTKVEIKKEHQVLMIDKTTSFKEKGKTILLESKILSQNHLNNYEMSMLIKQK